jgi:hypothetical protein
MISKSALLSSYEYVLNVIKDRIIKDVLVDYYSKDTDDIRFNQEIYNEKVESYILNAFSNVDLVVLVDSGLIVSKIETLGKFYSVEGFAKKVMEDIGYEDIKREIEKNIEKGISGIVKFLDKDDNVGRLYNKAGVLNSQDYADIVSKIEKDVILDILEDGEFEIREPLLYSLVNIAMLKDLGDVDFVLLTEYETINSDVEIPVIAYSLNKFCDKIVNEIYDSVKRGVEDVISENFEEDDFSSYMKI